MKNSKILIIFLAGLFILIGTTITEYIFDKQDKDSWVRRFEKKLHKEESRADKILESFRDSIDLQAYSNLDEDLVLVGLKNGRIFFWSDEAVGAADLYDKLMTGDNFVEVNNSFYEVRRKKNEDIKYFALLRIKTNYPYSNRYLQNNFGTFLGIGHENANNIEIIPHADDNGQVVSDKDGKNIFNILHNENYKDRSVNFVLLFFYLLFFLSLFYVFDLLLKKTRRLRWQVVYSVSFVVFLVLLRYIMISSSIPPSLYRLHVFDNSNVSADLFISSIGDLFMSAFSIIMILYIFFDNIIINSQNKWLIKLRYWIVAGFVLLAFLYINFFNYTIESIISNTEVHLNIARLIHIGVSLFVAFVAIILGGFGLIVIIDSAARVFKNFLSLKEVLIAVSLPMSFFAAISYFFTLSASFPNILFLWGIFLLAIVNRYLVKRDVQRSVYMLITFFMSVYIVAISKKSEEYNELMQRMNYSTELIEERDHNFEDKLVKISALIENSEWLPAFIDGHDEVSVRTYFTEEFLDLAGYNYFTDITFCRTIDSLRIVSEKKLWKCDDYFNTLILHDGKKIEGTNFYLLTDFDGIVSYIGKFPLGKMTLYLRFDSAKDSEGSGYPQILSRKSNLGEHIVYPYSYAKYKNGELISSSGDFNYYRLLERFGMYDKSVDLVRKDKYSHMLIPVEDDSMLVISLHDSFFTLYYINILYVFFVFIIISSYGLFFSRNQNMNFKKGTLKARIKNRIVLLIFMLFAILTAMSIYLNTKSFEERHNLKATELLKYINQKLEQLECVDYRECPEIRNILSEMSELLLVDINIYSDKGGLVATSRPEIFKSGFRGFLINPQALEHIVRDEAMSYTTREHIGGLYYLSAYMPLVLENGKNYILNVPYFTQNDELNLDIIIMIVIAVNIAIIVMVLAFILSGLVAEQVTKPLQLVNDKLKQMRFGGKNEKITYGRKDEVGALVQEYNNMVDKLDESIGKLAKSERESAWREMARQIAHEIKNPLTPMKLNIQFMQRAMSVENPEEFKKRVKDVSAILVEQIDNMASIASAFSDFAKMPQSNYESFNISELVDNSVRLFENNMDTIECVIEPDIMVFADKEQMSRVFLNILKNAEQSIPEDRECLVEVRVRRIAGKVEIMIKDNGRGIPEEIRSKIFEPNFTTKSSGMGLGLAISRRIIESMNGTIDFTSELGRGTEFFITLDCIN